MNTKKLSPCHTALVLFLAECEKTTVYQPDGMSRATEEADAMGWRSCLQYRRGENGVWASVPMIDNPFVAPYSTGWERTTLAGGHGASYFTGWIIRETERAFYQDLVSAFEIEWRASDEAQEEIAFETRRLRDEQETYGSRCW